MHSAAPEYESVAQIAQRSSTSHVAGCVTAGRKVWEELCTCHKQGRREAISIPRTTWYELKCSGMHEHLSEPGEQHRNAQGRDRRLASRAGDERLTSNRYTSAARTHGAASVGLVAPRRVG
jgi:hypothetical protein